MIVGLLPHDGPFAMVSIVVATQVLALVLGALAVRLPLGAGGPGASLRPVGIASGRRVAG
jgi:hypothetical protein